jgi:CHASE3 domain sensor protein
MVATEKLKTLRPSEIKKDNKEGYVESKQESDQKINKNFEESNKLIDAYTQQLGKLQADRKQTLQYIEENKNNSNEVKRGQKVLSIIDKKINDLNQKNGVNK